MVGTSCRYAPVNVPAGPDVAGQFVHILAGDYRSESIQADRVLSD
jgi:hypothetical protein